MKRFQYIELEDLPWFPAVLRDYMTDFLQITANKFQLFKGSIGILKKGLKESGGSKIVDLASGGGGAWLSLAPDLKDEHKELQVLLTDLYPNETALQRTVTKGGAETFSYESNSIDALDVPDELKGLRTQFLSFHHFPPDKAQQILQNAVDAGQPIAIFEAQERTIGDVIRHSFSPIFVLLITPFIRPFKLSRLLFTYLIPILPLAVLHDGVVSVLRTYSVDEMKAMAADVKGHENYHWEIDSNNDGPTKILYLLAYPIT